MTLRSRWTTISFCRVIRDESSNYCTFRPHHLYTIVNTCLYFLLVCFAVLMYAELAVVYMHVIYTAKILVLFGITLCR